MFATAAIHTKDLGHHRLPGVCISIFGFLLVFSGIMMLGIEGTAKDGGGGPIEIAGPVVLALGSAAVIVGFSLQFVLHKKHKKTLQRLTTAREKVLQSQQPAKTKTSADKYFAEDITPGTSRPQSAAPPIIMVDTITDDRYDLSYDMYAQDYKYLSPEKGQEDYYDLTSQHSSYDSSDDEEISVGPVLSQTHAVIEYRRRQSQDSVQSANSNKTDHSKSSSGSQGGSNADIVLHAGEEVVHINRSPPETIVTNHNEKQKLGETKVRSKKDAMRGLPPIRERTHSTGTEDVQNSVNGQFNSGYIADETDNDRPASGKTKYRKRSKKLSKTKKAQTHASDTEKSEYNDQKLNSDEDKESSVSHSPPISVGSFKARMVRRQSSGGAMTTSWITGETTESADTFSLSSSFSEFKDLPCVETPRHLAQNGQSSPSVTSSLSGSQVDFNDTSSGHAETGNELSHDVHLEISRYSPVSQGDTDSSVRSSITKITANGDSQRARDNNKTHVVTMLPPSNQERGGKLSPRTTDVMKSEHKLGSGVLLGTESLNSGIYNHTGHARQAGLQQTKILSRHMLNAADLPTDVAPGGGRWSNGLDDSRAGPDVDSHPHRPSKGKASKRGKCKNLSVTESGQGPLDNVKLTNGSCTSVVLEDIESTA